MVIAFIYTSLVLWDDSQIEKAKPWEWSPKAALNHPLCNASIILYLVPTTGGGGGGGGGINIPELPILPFPTGKH